MREVRGEGEGRRKNWGIRVTTKSALIKTFAKNFGLMHNVKIKQLSPFIIILFVLFHHILSSNIAQMSYM